MQSPEAGDTPTSLSHTATTTTTTTATKTTKMSDADRATCCEVCDDRATGVHFGLVVCRACAGLAMAVQSARASNIVKSALAAFYRRSTISGRKYICRFGDNCKISKGEPAIVESRANVCARRRLADVRCCCRACRFRKCEALGMSAEGERRFSTRRLEAFAI